jgi:hypothetical protein
MTGGGGRVNIQSNEPNRLVMLLLKGRLSDWRGGLLILPTLQTDWLVHNSSVLPTRKKP